jgi:trigger factor
LQKKKENGVLNDLGFDKHDTAAGDKYFKMLITKVGLVEKAELNDEFYKATFPTKEIKDEQEFRAAVKEDLQSYWDKQSSNHLQHELYHVLLDHTQIEFPETFLKRWLQNGGEEPKNQEQVEKEYPGFVNQLKWTLITDKLVRENNIEVGPDDLKAFAKQQLVWIYGRHATNG